MVWLYRCNNKVVNEKSQVLIASREGLFFSPKVAFLNEDKSGLDS